MHTYTKFKLLLSLIIDVCVYVYTKRCMSGEDRENTLIEFVKF